MKLWNRTYVCKTECVKSPYEKTYAYFGMFACVCVYVFIGASYICFRIEEIPIYICDFVYFLLALVSCSYRGDNANVTFLTARQIGNSIRSVYT